MADVPAGNAGVSRLTADVAADQDASLRVTKVGLNVGTDGSSAPPARVTRQRLDVAAQNDAPGTLITRVRLEVATPRNLNAAISRELLEVGAQSADPTRVSRVTIEAAASVSSSGRISRVVLEVASLQATASRRRALGCIIGT